MICPRTYSESVTKQEQNSGILTSGLLLKPLQNTAGCKVHACGWENLTWTGQERDHIQRPTLWLSTGEAHFCAPQKWWCPIGNCEHIRNLNLCRVKHHTSLHTMCVHCIVLHSCSLQLQSVVAVYTRNVYGTNARRQWCVIDFVCPALLEQSKMHSKAASIHSSALLARVLPIHKGLLQGSSAHTAMLSCQLNFLQTLN